MTVQGRHTQAQGHWLPAILLSLVVVVGMVVSAGLVGWVIGHDSTQRRAPRPAANSIAERDSSHRAHAVGGSAASGGEALDRCRVLFARQVRLAMAADASLDQWRSHIEAMNQLVAGVITLTQASEYWNDTRIGARRNVEKFRRLDARLEQSDLRCTNPTDLDASRNSKDRLADCRRANSAYADSIMAARSTLSTWEHHIHDMDALRDGKISPAQATAMWVQSWHIGARQLRTYHHQATQALHHQCR